MGSGSSCRWSTTSHRMTAIQKRVSCRWSRQPLSPESTSRFVWVSLISDGALGSGWSWGLCKEYYSRRISPNTFESTMLLGLVSYSGWHWHRITSFELYLRLGQDLWLDSTQLELQSVNRTESKLTRIKHCGGLVTWVSAFSEMRFWQLLRKLDRRRRFNLPMHQERESRVLDALEIVL